MFLRYAIFSVESIEIKKLIGFKDANENKVVITFAPITEPERAS